MSKRETRIVRVIVAMTQREKRELDRKARLRKETMSDVLREGLSRVPTPRA